MLRARREEFAVPVADVDKPSHTTWENAANSRPMVERAGISLVLLVSDAWHLPRAVAACGRVGLGVTPTPIGPVAGPHWWEGLELSDWLPTPGALTICADAPYEHLGQVWYQLQRSVQGAPRVLSGAGTDTLKDAST